MTDNTILNPGAAGDTIRDIDKGGLKTQVVTLDVGGAGAETLLTGTVPVSGTVAVTGVATSAKQDTAQTTLATLALESGGNLAAIKADVDKIPSQGQALAAGSTPVVLTAIQVAALTPPAAITGFALDSTVAKDSSLATLHTDLGLVAKDSTVAKDASLTTIDTDIKATQPRDVTDRAARLLGVITAANLDVALSTIASVANQATQLTNDTKIIALLQSLDDKTSVSGAGFFPTEIPEFVGAP